MNTPEQEIEALLRAAPAPKPPGGLRESLVGQIQLRNSQENPGMPRLARPSGNWFQRWWPALAPAAVSLACAAVLTGQQMQLNTIQQTLRSLPQPAATAPAAPSASAPNATSINEDAEIARLTELVARLKAEIAPLEQLRLENETLRRQLNAPAANALTPEELQAIANAQERAMRIQCVNNLKQLGLAVKVWALDNSNAYPAEVIWMTNEMGSPKILACPADKAHQAAADWSSYTPANCSYEYLGGTEEEPDRVMFRCPIHGSVGLCDGSVQMGVAKTHPEWFVQRDGKLFMQVPAQNP